MKTKVSTIKAPQATGPFSQAVATEDFIFTSGQVYLTSEGKLLEASMEEQVHQIMKNLQAILEEAGVSFAHVVKTTVYVTDMGIYKTFNTIYGSYMQEPFPAREVVCVKELPLGANIEISMIAAR